MIYRLVCDDGFFWIGYSITTHDATTILNTHKSNSKDAQTQHNHKAYRHIKQNWKNVKIEMIDADGKNEREHILKEQDNTKCLNLYNSDGSKTSAHPKYHIERNKAYREKHKDEQNRKAREKYAQNKAKAQLTANLTEA
jgi:hypothetical protein